MAIRHEIILSTTDPNNEIGLVKIRQADEETQTLVIQITENGIPRRYEGLQAFFCAKLGQSLGLGIIEQKLNANEMTDPKNGKLEYTMRPEDWQQIGRQVGYFSFRKMTDDHTYVEQFTTRDFNFTIIKNVFSEGLTEVKKNGSTYVWTIEDLLRLFKEYISDGKSDWEEFVDQNKEIIESVDPGGTILSELIRSRKPEGAEAAYPDLSTRLDKQFGVNNEFRSFEVDESFMKRVLNENSERGVNVKWFGALGDGKTDDGPAIKAAHEHANRIKAPVVYPYGKYYISEVNEIPIQTSVDFLGSEIIINDAPETVDNNLPIYSILPSKSSVVHDGDELVQNVSDKFKVGVKQIPELASDEGTRYLEIYNDEESMYARYGEIATPGQPRTDMIIVDGQGNLKTNLTYDFSKVTRIIENFVDESKLTFANGVFKSVGQNDYNPENSYNSYQRNISIMRSNTNLICISHSIPDDYATKQASGAGFIRLLRCCKILLEGIDLQPRIYKNGDVTLSGKYELAINKCSDVTLRRVDAYSDDPDVWGSHTGNYMKNLLIDDCKFNRLDSHYPSDTVSIINSTIGFRGITMVGYGKLLIENCTINSSNLITLREDYGSFWLGDIAIRGIKWNPHVNWCRLIQISQHPDWNFGMNPGLGGENRTISISDITIDSSRLDGVNAEIIRSANYTDNTNLANDYYRLGSNLLIDNIKLTDYSKAGISVMYLENILQMRSFARGSFWENSTINSIMPNFFISVKNTKLGNYLKYSSDAVRGSMSNIISTLKRYNDITDVDGYSLILDINISNCRDVDASLYGMAAKLSIRDSLVRTLCNDYGGGSRSNTYLNNCDIAPVVNKEFASSRAYIIKTIPGKPSSLIFENCRFRGVVDTEGNIVDPEDNYFKSAYDIFSGFSSTSGTMYIQASLINCFWLGSLNIENIWPSLVYYGLAGKKINGSGTNYAKYGLTSARPANPPIGHTYFNTVSNVLQVYNGTSWA